MEQKLKNMISKELERFHCSVLLDEMREKVRKLKSYGLEDSEIEAVLYDNELLPKLIITKDYKIVVEGKTSREIMMEPLMKAVYILFLRHPEGIVFKHLPDYRDELTSIYKKLRPQGLNKRSLQSIEDVTNPMLNSINEKCARIRSAFVKEFNERLAINYYITGERGMPKKILLPRELVIWE